MRKTHPPLPACGRPRTRLSERCGDDIGGIAVHIGACVSALAGPNDVLVSSTLHDLVIGSGLEFEERGAHKLKGVPGEWHLFAVAST
jgi:class 3 adenylate cyclase